MAAGLRKNLLGFPNSFTRPNQQISVFPAEIFSSSMSVMSPLHWIVRINVREAVICTASTTMVALPWSGWRRSRRDKTYPTYISRNSDKIVPLQKNILLVSYGSRKRNDSYTRVEWIWTGRNLIHGPLCVTTWDGNLSGNWHWTLQNLAGRLLLRGQESATWT